MIILDKMKKYNIIYCDPPWSYNDQGCQGTMANHYEGMRLEDIKNLSINQIADENCVLFLWATYPMLQEALEVIKAWGFIYKSIAFQWVKMNKIKKTPFYGLGRWTRGNTEPCLLATKGKPKRVSASVFQLIFVPRRKHSQKPDIARDKIIQLVGELPRIELFATKKINGWDSIGYEIDGRDIRDVLQEMIEE